MNETERYALAKEYLSNHMVFKCKFQKYGVMAGNSVRATCLTLIKPEGSDIEIDHLWVESLELVDAKLRTGQPITIKGTLVKRKRPSAESSEIQLDLRLNNVKLIKKGKRP